MKGEIRSLAPLLEKRAVQDKLKLLQEMIAHNLPWILERVFPSPPDSLDDKEAARFRAEQAESNKEISEKLQQIMRGVTKDGNEVVVTGEDVTMIEQLCGTTIDSFKEQKMKGQKSAIVEEIYLGQPQEIKED